MVGYSSILIAWPTPYRPKEILPFDSIKKFNSGNNMMGKGPVSLDEYMSVDEEKKETFMQYLMLLRQRRLWRIRESD